MQKFIVIIFCLILLGGSVLHVNAYQKDTSDRGRISAIDRIRMNIDARKEMRKERIGVIERIRLNKQFREDKRKNRRESRKEKR